MCDGQVFLGPRFSVTSELKRFVPRDPRPASRPDSLCLRPRFSTPPAPPGASPRTVAAASRVWRRDLLEAAPRNSALTRFAPSVRSGLELVWATESALVSGGSSRLLRGVAV